jgi:hypothetical protein
MPIPTPGDQIVAGLKQITDWVTMWAVPLVGIGTVSMAVLQVVKSVFPLRSRFQRKHILSWLKGRTENGASDAEIDLIKLATDGDDAAFYNSPIEDSFARIKATVPVILDYPDKHIDLFKCLASQADAHDIKLVLGPPPLEIFYKRGDLSTHEEKEKLKEFAAAKARVMSQVRCAIDAAESSIQYRWKHLLQVASFLLSAILGAVALGLGASPKTAPAFGAVIIIGLLSGFLAPVARDLIAAIESWRS